MKRKKINEEKRMRGKKRVKIKEKKPNFNKTCKIILSRVNLRENFRVKLLYLKFLNRIKNLIKRVYLKSPIFYYNNERFKIRRQLISFLLLVSIEICEEFNISTKSW